MTKELDVIKKGLAIAPGDCKLLDDCTCDRCQALAALVTVREQVAEMERLNRQAICVYCGHIGEGATRQNLREIMAAHITDCKKHPINRIVEIVGPLEQQIAALTQELADLNGTFDLRHAADMRAIGLWREGHPDRELCQPDQADLIIWLMEREIALTQERNEAVDRLRLERDERIAESMLAGYRFEKEEARATQLEGALREITACPDGISKTWPQLDAIVRSALSAPAETPEPQPEAPLSPGDTTRRVRDERIPQIRASLKGLQSAMDAEYGMAKESLFKTWSDWVATAICALAIPGDPDSQSSGPLSPGERSIAEYIDQHGITCDCCQHVMIDVTSVQSGVKQHCIAGDPESDGCACANGMLLDSTRQTTPIKNHWACFHCGFEANTEAEAEAHFGGRDDAEEFTPFCTWWATLAAEDRAQHVQDLQRELNDAHAHAGELNMANEALQQQIAKLHARLSASPEPK